MKTGQYVYLTWTTETAHGESQRRAMAKIIDLHPEKGAVIKGFGHVGRIALDGSSGYTVAPVKWRRLRFLANGADYRPIDWPPPGPYWCTGYTNLESDHENRSAVIVAYVPESCDLQKFWPDAENIEATPCDEIIFSERFPKPSYWQ